MMAFCHFLALVISKPFLVKLGRISLLILARILNISYIYFAKIEKTTEFSSLFHFNYENNLDFSDCFAFSSSTLA